jgi:hypothetical protein
MHPVTCDHRLTPEKEDRTMIEKTTLDQLCANPSINPATGQPVVLCIDADCPSCGHPERNFDTATGLFGCSQCEYTSTERNT